MMRRKLFSKLAHGLIGAAAVTALVLSIVTGVKLAGATSLVVKNASGDCNQALSQRQESGNQSATQQCGADANVVVARARGTSSTFAGPGRCLIFDRKWASASGA